MLAAAARAEPVLAAALLAADAAVGLPLAAADAARARSALPLGLRRWLNPRLASPLVFVEHPPQIARVRLLLLAGRRLELVRRTLLLPETPAGDTRLAGRLAHACARLMRLLPSPRRRASDQPLHARSCGEPESRQPAKQGADDTLGEAALRQLLASHSSVRFTVTGRCMEPAIREGEQVRLVGPERRSPRVGDVVLVRLPSGLRLHRLVWGPPFSAPIAPGAPGPIGRTCSIRRSPPRRCSAASKRSRAARTRRGVSGGRSSRCWPERSPACAGACVVSPGRACRAIRRVDSPSAGRLV